MSHYYLNDSINFFRNCGKSIERLVEHDRIDILTLGGFAIWSRTSYRDIVEVMWIVFDVVSFQQVCVIEFSYYSICSGKIYGGNFGEALILSETVVVNLYGFIIK